MHPYRQTALSILPLKNQKQYSPQVKVCCVKITFYLCLLHHCLYHLFSALVFSDSCKWLIQFHTSCEFLMICYMMLNHNSRLTVQHTLSISLMVNSMEITNACKWWYQRLLCLSLKYQSVKNLHVAVEPCTKSWIKISFVVAYNYTCADFAQEKKKIYAYVFKGAETTVSMFLQFTSQAHWKWLSYHEWILPHKTRWPQPWTFV